MKIRSRVNKAVTDDVILQINKNAISLTALENFANDMELISRLLHADEAKTIAKNASEKIRDHLKILQKSHNHLAQFIDTLRKEK